MTEQREVLDLFDKQDSQKAAEYEKFVDQKDEEVQRRIMETDAIEHKDVHYVIDEILHSTGIITFELHRCSRDNSNEKFIDLKRLPETRELFATKAAAKAEIYKK